MTPSFGTGKPNAAYGGSCETKCQDFVLALPRVQFCDHFRVFLHKLCLSRLSLAQRVFQHVVPDRMDEIEQFLWTDCAGLEQLGNGCIEFGGEERRRRV